MQNILLDTRHGTRHLLPPYVRDTLLAIPSDTTSLERNYVLADEDLELIDTWRSAANRLALAIHIALFRRPGQGWLEGTHLPGALPVWLAEQIAVPVSALADYGTTRGETRSDHRRLAMRHLGLHPFVSRDDTATATQLAAWAAFDTDDGRLILERLTSELKALRCVLPSASRLERIGLAGHARARRLSAQALNGALDELPQERSAGTAQIRPCPWAVPSDLDARTAAFHQRDEPPRTSGQAEVRAGTRAAGRPGPRYSSGQARQVRQGRRSCLNPPAE